MPSDDSAEEISRLRLAKNSSDDALGHRIITTYVWAVREGPRRPAAY